MSLAVFVLQGFHARALMRTPVTGDPSFDVNELRSVMPQAGLAVANILCEGPEVTAFRAALPQGCPVYGVANAHAFPTYLPPSPYRAALHALIQEDALPEYRLGLAAYEQLPDVVERQAEASGLDGVMWDELFWQAPAWLQARWTVAGRVVVSPGAVVTRWPKLRDTLIEQTSLPSLANIGTSNQYAHLDYPELAISIEEGHGTLPQIIRALAAAENPLCTVWPADPQAGHRNTFIYAAAGAEIPGICLRGVRVPQE
jgi:hypothetical protein